MSCLAEKAIQGVAFFSSAPKSHPAHSQVFIGVNSIEEEIKERIVLGNKAFCANQALFKRKLLSKKCKLKMYRTLVRPVVTCACKTWVLKGTIKQKLLVFGRKMLRRIFGPTKERDGTWRIKRNDEQTDWKQNYNKLY
jgi:hypothetical protein